MERICSNYCGIACIDGRCPIALSDKYSEYGCDVVNNCGMCFYYEGCCDCYFDGTDMCSHELMADVSLDDFKKGVNNENIGGL